MKRRRNLLVGAGVLSVALWALPGFGFITLPLVYLNTLIHEMCHAIAATATGGDVRFVQVFASGSGVTLSQGGSGLLLASAGYVGASLVGGLMIACSVRPQGAKVTLQVVGAVLAVGLALWLRGDRVGFVASVLWIGALLVAGSKLEGDNVVFAAQFLGMQQCLTSVLALYVLLQINTGSGIHNDAALAAQMTGLPAFLWAVLWCGLSLLGMWAALRSALREGAE